MHESFRGFCWALPGAFPFRAQRLLGPSHNDMRKMRSSCSLVFCWSVVSLLLLLTPFSHLAAAVITASSASRFDVGSAVAVAADGDTVAVPRGTAFWTNTLTITRAITLQGAGVGQTIIKDYITNSTGAIIDMTAVANKNSRITGFEFGNGNRVVSSYAGSIALKGINTNGGTVRLDHCKFDRLLSHFVAIHGSVGVIDHCDFAFDGPRIGIYVYDLNWDGKTYGDGSWATPVDWNGGNWIVVEDCSFTNTVTHYAVIDSIGGSRYVFRHNKVHNGWVEAHGTESGNRFRGTRAVQVYNNAFNSTRSGFGLVNLRGGTATVCSNTATGYGNTTAVHLGTYRAFFKFVPWGGADGTNAWDNNVVGGPFATGTHNGASGVTTLTDSSKNWTPNQWVGFTVRNSRTDRHSEIITNTSTTITYGLIAGFGPDMTFSNGDDYAILKVGEAIDQPGKGLGDLLRGDYPTPVWLNQADEPVYSWANTVNGVNGGIASQNAFIRNGEHYFNNIPRPSFAPMSYPHPLITGSGTGGGSVANPRNLRVVDVQ